jgi:hypothetical protein
VGKNVLTPGPHQDFENVSGPICLSKEISGAEKGQLFESV